MITPAIIAVDTRGLDRGIALARKWNKRAPAEAVNTAALYVASDAMKRTPAVPLATIDAQLDVIKTPVIGKRGKPLKNKSRFTDMGGSSKFAGVPLAALIIQSRSLSKSPDYEGRVDRYNALTNFRYATAHSPFFGKSRESGRQAMADAIHKLIARRHSSVAFIKSGWVAAIKTLSKFARIRGTTGVREGSDRAGDLGFAIPARPELQCQAQIENDVGERGVQAESFRAALIKYGEGPLQQAVDDEGKKQLEYYLKKSHDEELARQFNAACK